MSVLLKVYVFSIMHKLHVRDQRFESSQTLGEGWGSGGGSKLGEPPMWSSQIHPSGGGRSTKTLVSRLILAYGSKDKGKTNHLKNNDMGNPRTPSTSIVQVPQKMPNEAKNHYFLSMAKKLSKLEALP